jgi:NAD(P)-dependent dehydrogenase (short-subunit alcohol dehydrogenase family)
VYRKWAAYGQSKLANLLFTYELQRRLQRAALGVIAVACHPGYAATNLQFGGVRMKSARIQERMIALVNRVLAQPAAAGAWPTIYAATEPEIRGGDFVGPGGFQEIRGIPRIVSSNQRSYREDDARRLWEISCELTGVGYELMETQAAAQ